MTPYASVALIKRDGNIVFRPARKVSGRDLTQIRKASVRFWNGNLAQGDSVVKVIIMRSIEGRVEISERDRSGRWHRYDIDILSAFAEPHLAACLAELGVDPQYAPPPVPDVLVINGWTYRRDV